MVLIQLQVMEIDSSFSSELVPKSEFAGATLLAQFLGVDPCTGHVVVIVWPPVMLTSKLPLCDIIYSQKGAHGTLRSSETIPIAVGLNGGEVARLHAQPSSDRAEGWANEPATSVILFCPPLGENSSSFLTSQGPTSAVSSTDIVYILSPGEATKFNLPCKGPQRKIPCLLLTEKLPNCPALCLQIIPESKFLNNLPLPFDFQVRFLCFCCYLIAADCHIDACHLKLLFPFSTGCCLRTY